MYEVALDPRALRAEGVAAYLQYAALEWPMRRLLARFNEHATQLKSLRIWLISSTERGGGVAEMLPRIVCLMQELGVECHWLIMEVPGTERAKRFYALTKRLHNALHGAGAPLHEWWPPWVYEIAAEADRVHYVPRASAAAADADVVVLEGGASPPAPPPAAAAHAAGEPINLRAFRYLFESVGSANADEFLARYAPSGGLQPHRDLVIVHDPQPAAMIAALKAACPALRTIWRSHIGLDETTPVTESAWALLRPHVEQFSAAVFS